MYNSPPTLELKTDGIHNFMNIGIRQMEPIAGLTLQILRLWATPDSNTENGLKYELVTDQCPETVGEYQGINYKIFIMVSMLTNRGFNILSFTFW